MSEEDDILKQLGVELKFEPRVRKTKQGAIVECGQAPPREKPRFTEWSNLHNFEAAGYVARVDRWLCKCCDNIYDTLEGVFVLELHKPSGTRRLTAILMPSKGGQFPMGLGYNKEVTEHEVEMCGNCIGDLGFSREVDSHGQPYTLVVGKGKV